jgi:hypothetical protein
MPLNLLSKYAHFIFPILGLAHILIVMLHYPPGVSMDSVSYIEISNNLMNGKGYTNAAGMFVNHWPPMYPLVLSAISSLLDIDVLAASKLLSVLLIFIFLFITNLVIAKFRFDSLIAILLNVFILLSPALQVFLMLWSEGLFMCILMLILYVILVWNDSGKRRLLIIAGVLSGVLILTRLAGIGFVGGIILYVLLDKSKSLKVKLGNAGLLSVFAFLFLFAWLYYSSLFENHTTERQLSFHLFTPGHLVVFVRSLAAWFFPLYTEICGAVAFLIILWVLIKDKIAPGKIIQSWFSKPYLLLLFMSFSYLLFLFCSIIFIHYSTPLDNRILAPLLPLLSILLVPVIRYLFQTTSMKMVLHVLLIFIFLNLVAGFTGRSYDFYKNGKGYTSATWLHSPTLKYLSENKSFRNIHSNATDVLRFYKLNDRNLFDLPFWIDSDSKKHNDNYQAELNALKQSIASGESVLVYFDHITWRYYFPTKEKIKLEFAGFEVKEFEDGIVVGKRDER